MVSKTLVFITGGNNGLGYYATQQLAASGKYHMLLGGRDFKKAEAAVKSLVEDSSMKVDAKDLEPVQIDVTSDESIKAAVKTVEEKYGYLDVLMVNAGIAQQQSAAADGSGPTLRELYQSHFNTNLFGAAVTVDAFLPLLRKSKNPAGKRIVFTTSSLGSLAMATNKADPAHHAKNYPVYRSTKTAMNMIMLHYAAVLEDEGFIVSASNPGYCATNLNNHNGLKDPRDGAKALIRGVIEPKEKVHALTVNDTDVDPW